MAEVSASRISSPSSLVKRLLRLVKQYESAIVRDPSFATKIEVFLKVSAYLIPGKISSWKHLSELAYTVSNLVYLLNDYLMINNCPSVSIISKLPLVHRNLLWCISVLEYVEVLAEISSEYFWREAGKWCVVLLMRLIKLVLQCVAILRYGTHVISSPAVPCVDRKKVKYTPTDIIQPPEGKQAAYIGKRTGKVIRSIYADPAIPYSELHNYIPEDAKQRSLEPAGRDIRWRSDPSTAPLEVQRVVAELLHVSRPLVHILCMVKYNQASWKPWLISLVMDVLSLHLHGGLLKFSKNEDSAEILRRRLVLLLYLLRSPFYDTFTKDSLLSVLQGLSQYVPLIRFIIGPMMDYLPVWQHIYSYCWMS